MARQLGVSLGQQGLEPVLCFVGTPTYRVRATVNPVCQRELTYLCRNTITQRVKRPENNRPFYMTGAGLVKRSHRTLKHMRESREALAVPSSRTSGLQKAATVFQQLTRIFCTKRLRKNFQPRAKDTLWLSFYIFRSALFSAKIRLESFGKPDAITQADEVAQERALIGVSARGSRPTPFLILQQQS